MDDFLGQIEKLKLLPMVKIEDPGKADAVAGALIEGGLPCAEITFRTDAAEEAIRRLSAMDRLLLGAGTVVNVEQAGKAIEGGAGFIVTPGFSRSVVEYCLKAGVLVIPGTSTPTDLQTALEYGITTVKFFPAEASGGLKTLKAVSAPYPMMRFVPTGGIKESNLKGYLDFPKVVACGGSWLSKADLIERGDFAEITRRAREAVRIATG